MNGGLFMAQTLKKELREKIITSATLLMKKKGIENCDMRSIAQDTGMTVGNLYRYFKNKEELVYAIIQPMVIEIEEIIEHHSQGFVSLSTYQIQDMYFERLNLDEQFEMVNQLMIQVVRDFHELAQSNYDVMLILLQDADFQMRIELWLKQIIKELFDKSYELVNVNDLGFQIILKTQVKSVVVGLNTFLQLGCECEPAYFTELLVYYVQQITQTFKSMLEQQLDLKRVVKKGVQYE